MKKFVLFGILAVLVVLVVSAAGYFGAFVRVKVVEKQTDAIAIVYTKHIGDYSKVGPPMDSLYRQLLDSEKIATTRGFGLYYDNPRAVAKEQLRSVVGCVLNSIDTAALARLVAKGYRTAVIPPSKCIAAEFPMRGMPSIILGVIKVYPVLAAYQQQKNISKRPVMELYDTPAKKTSYIIHEDIGDEVYEALLR